MFCDISHSELETPGCSLSVTPAPPTMLARSIHAIRPLDQIRLIAPKHGLSDYRRTHFISALVRTGRATLAACDAIKVSTDFRSKYVPVLFANA